MLFFRSAKTFSFLFLLFLVACESDPRNRSHASVPLATIERGKALAATYCASCHLLPDPKWLNAKTWETGVLPQMGPRLGIFEHRFQDYPSYRRDANLPGNFYPSKPLLSADDWQCIINYYAATSPDSLEGQKRLQKIKPTTPLFAAQQSNLQYDNATTSYVRIAPPSLPYALVFSDALRQQTYFLDKRGLPVDSVHNSGPVVDMSSSPDSLLVCNIGELNPTNAKLGKLNLLVKRSGRWAEENLAVTDSLQRPVQLTGADINGDGRQDYVVCEFGFLTGALSWLEGDEKGRFTRHVLRPVPGAIKAYVTDWNKDNRPDICVLFAQGDESILLFTNQGNGRFETRQLLRFPPVYGSSYFELADFNNDGHPDIVYTCGDNADYSPILKPYHGVYVFLNDGTDRFRQQYFFPINGCYKAVARDFDGDGDLDLATISFFADYTHQPEEGFVYLRNEGSWQFKPFSVPEAKKGRWLTMDTGDVDGDGRPDIVLGNFFIGPNIMAAKTDWSKAPPYLWLKNTGRK